MCFSFHFGCINMDLNNFRVKKAPCTVYYVPDFISAEEEKLLLSRVYQAPKTKWTVLSHRRLQNWGGLPGPKGMVAEDLPQWLQVYSQKIAELGAFEGKVPNHVLVNEYLPGQGIMPHEDGPAFYPTVSTITLGSHTLLDFYYHLNAGHATGQSPATPPSDSCRSSETCTGQRSSSTQMKEQLASCEVEEREGKDGDGQCVHDGSTIVDSSCSRGIEQECERQSEGGDSSMDKRHFLSLLLQPRSLLLLQDDMYKVHLHGIKEVTNDCITDKVVNLDLVPEVNVGDVMARDTRVSLTIRYVPKVLKSRLILGKR